MTSIFKAAPTVVWSVVVMDPGIHGCPRERARLADDPDHHGLTSCKGVAVVAVIEAWKSTTGEEHEALDFVVGPALVEDEEAARASQAN